MGFLNLRQGLRAEIIPSIIFHTAGLFEQKWAAWSRTSMKLINGSLHRVVAYQKANQNVTSDRLTNSGLN
jgi:hypothetical protein